MNNILQWPAYTRVNNFCMFLRSFVRSFVSLLLAKFTPTEPSDTSDPFFFFYRLWTSYKITNRGIDHFLPHFDRFWPVWTVFDGFWRFLTILTIFDIFFYGFEHFGHFWQFLTVFSIFFHPFLLFLTVLIIFEHIDCFWQFLIVFDRFCPYW